MNEGEALLVHSFKGMNRSVIVISAYLMYQFNWAANKALDYLKLKKPGIKLRAEFYQQLLRFERILKSQGRSMSVGWRPKGIGKSSSGGSDYVLQSRINFEEVVLNNTYLNSRAVYLVSNHVPQTFKKKSLDYP